MPSSSPSSSNGPVASGSVSLLHSRLRHLVAAHGGDDASVGDAESEPPTTSNSMEAFEEVAVPAPERHGGSAERWEETLRHCVQAVVSIRVNQVMSFDTERATFMQATGFVVDAERGLILTNRHVVTSGPITAEAVFHDHEEVPVTPVYRDPVHDFAFLRFDVSRLRYQRIVAIPLCPEGARVGTEIRVVGNDAGEKLSILAGTLARLDRRAPTYGLGAYNDFNTFYLQAASSTSGGSSGSPVLNIAGAAIAMNAGGKRKAASSYYLPLDRVARALRLLRAGEPITRGTLQTTFVHEPYDEVRRLGLPAKVEMAVRRSMPGGTGMLVVERVLPEGPASGGALEPGDVLLELDGTLVTHFTRLDTILDSRVGKAVRVVVYRGTQRLERDLSVQDLHTITPARLVSLSGAVLHTLSYQMARSYAVPVRGVYVAAAGYMLAMAGIPRGALLTHVDGTETGTLDEFIAAVARLPDGARVPFRFLRLSDVNRHSVVIVKVDRHWHRFATFTRDDERGLWAREDLGPPPIPREPVFRPGRASFLHVDAATMGPAQGLVASLVLVEFNAPFTISGLHGTRFLGTGVIVDDTRGLVLVDANTVPINLGDVWVSIASSLQVPGHIVFLHPTQNFAVIRYDPVLIQDTAVRRITLGERPLRQGDATYLVGMDESRVVSRRTLVTNVRELILPEFSPPRFRPINAEVIEIDNPVACLGGVLCDELGAVQGFWHSFAYQKSNGEEASLYAGTPLESVLPLLEPLMRGEKPELRTLALELVPSPITTARGLGLSDEWASRLERANPTRRSALCVRRLTAGTPASELIIEGDLILAVDGTAVVTFGDFERACLASSGRTSRQNADSAPPTPTTGPHTIRLHVLRNREEIELDVATVPVVGDGPTRLIFWSGVILQEPHLATFQQQRRIPGYVYSSWWSTGSPAHMYGLRATVWITEINGEPITDLDSFLHAVMEHSYPREVLAEVEEASAASPIGDEDDESIPLTSPRRNSLDANYIRVKIVDFSNRVRVLTLKPDDHYWPLTELIQDASVPCGWRLRCPRPSSVCPSPR